MKKYIALTALLAAGSAFANAATITETYSPLKEDGWTLDSARESGQSNMAKQDQAAGTVYANDPWWKRPYATYDDINLSLLSKDDSISFSFTMAASVIEVHNVICSVALKGTSGTGASTIMMGVGGNYDSAKNTHFKSAVVEDNESAVYLFDTSAWGEEGFDAYNCVTTSTNELFALPTAAESGKTEFVTTFSGEIKWSDVANGFVLNLTQAYNEDVSTKEYILGATYSMSGISIAMDGNSTNGDKDEFTISNFVISHTMTIPEPSTFGLLAGLGALALVGTRRRRK